MKKTALVTLVIIALMMVCIIGIDHGIEQKSTEGPIGDYRSIASLRRSVDFQFSVPDIISESTNLEMHCYGGSMVEIIDPKQEITFRAARFIDENADVNGDYSKYETDVRYIDNMETMLLRYRGGDQGTLINIRDGSIVYGVKFTEKMSPEQAFAKLDIDFSKLEAFPDEEPDKSESGESLETSGEQKIDTPKTEELSYKLYAIDDMDIQFMLPETNSKVVVASTEDQLAVMIDTSIIFVIEYRKEGFKLEEFIGFSIRELSDKHLLRYVVDNPFKRDTEQYRDYYTIIENVDVVVDTFKFN